MSVSTICSAVDSYRDLILKTERQIWNNPEVGYTEWKTTKYLEGEYEKLGYRLVKAGNIPGFYTDIDTGRPGPKILILGELDSLVCETHPERDKETGAVHACGHNAQSATLLGIAAALKKEGVLDNMCGSIRLCAVPAEEVGQTEYRMGLRAEGKIKYLCGKDEFLYRGYFDGVDIAFMFHTASFSEPNTIVVRRGGAGFIVKNITYKGVAAHAGGSPQNGINALYAATLGLQAANSLRETFVEADKIRFHPIITEGGSVVNAIPDKVVIETFLRSIRLEAFAPTNARINRALAGAAASMGANVNICDLPGNMPYENDKNMISVVTEAMSNLMPAQNIKYADEFSTGSTDMGDLMAVMPAIHPNIGGAVGASHGNNYYIKYPEIACVTSAKGQILMLETLLSDNAERAKRVIAEKKVQFPSKEAYFKYIDSLFSDRELLTYDKNGSINITY